MSIESRELRIEGLQLGKSGRLLIAQYSSLSTLQAGGLLVW